MATLPISSSIKLHSNIPVPKVSGVFKEKNLSHVVAAATITATPRTSNTNVFEELSLKPTGSITNQILIKDLGLNVHKSRFSALKSETKAEGLEKEVGVIIQRLEAFGERIRELEIEKFMGRIKGEELSYEESILVENMGREIVSKFLEKPIQYLRSRDGDLEDKLKELSFLVGILEKSCPMKEKIKIHA